MPAVNTVEPASKEEAIEFMNDNVDLAADKVVITKKDDGTYTCEATYPDPTGNQE